MQGGVFYAVQPSPVAGVQQLVYSVPVDSSSAGLLHGSISDQPPTATVQVNLRDLYIKQVLSRHFCLTETVPAC